MGVVPEPDYNTQQPFAVYSYYFNSKTPNLATGVPILVPNPGTLVWSARIVVLQAFDGTTPKADLGFLESGATGVFAELSPGAVPVDLTAASAVYGPALKMADQEDVSFLIDNPPTPGNPLELRLIVNQTGVVGGAASGSTVGQATLFIVMAEPISLNIQEPPLPL